MQHGHGELEPLLDAERQAVGSRVDHGLQVIALQQLLNSPGDLVRRQVVELRVQLQILSDRQLAIEREGLRHVADAAARLHVVRAHGLAEQLAGAAGRGKEADQHFHRGGLAAAVRAEEPEDFAAWNLEADVVDRDEVAEPAREPLGFDRGRLVGRGDARPDDHLRCRARLASGIIAMNASSRFGSPVLASSSFSVPVAMILPSSIAISQSKRSASSM